MGDSPGEAGGGGGVGGGRGGAAASAPSHGSSGAGAAVAGGTGAGSGGQGDGVSPLAQFLIERACESLELANFFYWYLRVDQEDASHGHIYRGVQAAFKRAMRQNTESARVMGECGGERWEWQGDRKACRVSWKMSSCVWGLGCGYVPLGDRRHR